MGLFDMVGQQFGGIGNTLNGCFFPSRTFAELAQQQSMQAAQFAQQQAFQPLQTTQMVQQRSGFLGQQITPLRKKVECKVVESTELSNSTIPRSTHLLYGG